MANSVEEIEKRLASIESRLDAIETLLKHHAYVGVPDEFREIRGNLSLMMKKLGIGR